VKNFRIKEGEKVSREIILITDRGLDHPTNLPSIFDKKSLRTGPESNDTQMMHRGGRTEISS